ncbi:MAG: phosphate ABC transporter substrate-binding protein PstS [Thermoplasmata archaeon]|nr:phosphate ABC transporter substrate-binding protein PstS [Thermoplasmata archaeon]
MSSGNASSAETPPTTPASIQRPAASRTGMYAAVAIVVVLIVIVVGAYAGGFLTPKSTNNGGCTPPAAKITGEGSTLVFPLMYYWESTWAGVASGSSVNYLGAGSTAGINAITGITVNYGASDAPLNPAQRAAAVSGTAKQAITMIPESAGAVVPIYNLPGLKIPLNFTGHILAEIYDGAITNWQDPQITAINAEDAAALPNAGIIPVHRLDGSGTTFVFTTFLAKSDSTWNSTYGHATTIANWPSSELAESGNSGIAGTVKVTADSIGYVDVNFALSQSIAYGAVQNPAGNYVLANVTNIASALADSKAVMPAPTADWYNYSVENSPGAQDYPIATFTYVLVYQDMGKAFGALMTKAQVENLVSFLHWIVTVGQQYSASLFYVPLPASVVASDQATINAMTYNGASISVCTPGA